AYVALTARAAATFFGQDYAAFAAQVEKNFNRLFVKAAAYETMQ
ncbi:MAG TPA: LuxR family transcriptional regulator, partial [Rhodobacteraceae bacterium]|nr:LuxR family transcriptional regulator [Paracoccaceae bacterium]